MPEARRIAAVDDEGAPDDGAGEGAAPLPLRRAAGAPLQRRATGDLVAEHLRRQIFDGVLRPGDRITPERIAEDLAVSRLPVREALLGMARDGLVVMQAHQGAYVGDFDAEVLRDHFEIVGAVQGLAAVRLAHRADVAVVDRLAGIVDRLERSGSAGEVHDLVMDFHRLINSEGGSSRQRSVLRALGRMLPTGFFASIPGAAQSGPAGAARILAAIRSSDDDAIRRVCVEVQRDRAEIVVAHLRAAGVFAPEGDADTAPAPPAAPRPARARPRRSTP